MAIQWFPGHMHTTRLALVARIAAGIDVVIELLDARLPGSSANPLLAQLTTGKPTLKLLNKQDLADPARTALWLDHYNARPETRAIALDAGETAPAARLIPACRALAPLRGGMVKPLRVLVCGVPNVGKSTLINTLLRRKAAKTGDEAGITRAEQVIALASDITLFDTPGMLWPRIEEPETGLHLAASGAVGRNAYDEQEVALALLQRLQQAYPGQLIARYKLASAPTPEAAAALAAQPAEAVLALVAQRRGGVRAGGRLDLHKGAEAVLNDFRAGALGRITLETPAEHALWQAAARQAQAAKAARTARTARRAGTPAGAAGVQAAEAAEAAGSAGTAARKGGDSGDGSGEQGGQCEEGERGERGEPGERGERGERGEPGVQGEPGAGG